MKRFVLIALIVAVFAVGINDGGRMFSARTRLRSSTKTLVEWASGGAAGLSRGEAAKQLVERAALLGITVYQYTQDENGVQIWTETQVTGLWVWGTYSAALKGVPFRQALGSTVTVRDYASGSYQ